MLFIFNVNDTSLESGTSSRQLLNPPADVPESRRATGFPKKLQNWSL